MSCARRMPTVESMHRFALALAISAFACAAPAAANGRITYDRIEFRAGGPTTLWSSQIGDVATRITQCSGCSQEASWRSSDGTRVFFDSDLVPPVHVFSSKLDGSDVQQVTFSATGFEGYPSVSPDDLHVAYDGQDDESGLNQGIYVARVDGSGTPERLTVAPRGFIDTSPAWSPDGTLIAFVRLRLSGCGWRCRSHAKFGPEGFKGAVYMMQSDGSHVHRLTPDNGHVWADPSWAPDSRSLLVQAYEIERTPGAPSNEYSIGVNGRDLRQITGGKGEFWFSGDYSPDGTRIAVSHIAPPYEHVDVVDMAADGSDQHVIAVCPHASVFCDNPNW
jgi:Tol biopolymer transport system component